MVRRVSRAIGLRTVAAAFGLLAATSPLSAQVPRIGVLCTISCTTPDVAAFLETLAKLGYRHDATVAVELRSADGDLARLPSLAGELVTAKVDVIYTSWGTAAALAAKRTTTTIPVVVGAAGDLVATGLVPSLNRPAGNVTGISSLALEIEGKRLELLKELVPSISLVAAFVDVNAPYSTLAMKQQRDAADRLGIRLREIQVARAGDVDEAFAIIVREGITALSIHGYGGSLASRQRIVELANKHRIVAIYPTSEFVDAGGLIAYGANLRESARRAAGYVAKILKGAKPADLPVDQPTEVELIINMRAARAIDLVIRPSLLARTTEIIE